MVQRSSPVSSTKIPDQSTASPSQVAPLTVVLLERRVLRTLLGIIGVLLLAGLISVMIKLYLPDFFGRDLFIGLFDLNNESNVPAAFSALILLLASLILGVIAWARGRAGATDAFSWKALTFIFGFLTLDEAAMLHERTADITMSMVNTDGILYYAWVLPYGVLALVVGLAFIRFLIQLPADIRNRVMLAGAVYVGGALGFELLEGVVVSAQGTQNLLNQGLVWAEEGLEMLGVTLFIGALLRYVRLYRPGLRLHLSVGAQSAPDASSR